jgi:hypothetical protein
MSAQPYGTASPQVGQDDPVGPQELADLEALAIALNDLGCSALLLAPPGRPPHVDVSAPGRLTPGEGTLLRSGVDSEPGGEGAQSLVWPGLGVCDGADGFADHGVVTDLLGCYEPGGVQGVKRAAPVTVIQPATGQVDAVVASHAAPGPGVSNDLKSRGYSSHPCSSVKVGLATGRDMDQTQPSITSTVEAMETVFDGRWGIWLSDTGRWWASRRDSLSAADLGAGCVPFLRADTADELAERIQEQEALCPPESAGHQAAGAQPSRPRSGLDQPPAHTPVGT